MAERRSLYCHHASWPGILGPCVVTDMVLVAKCCMQDTGDFHHRDFLILVSLPRRRNNRFIKADRSTCPPSTNPCPMIITAPCHTNPPHNLQYTTVKRSAAASVDLVASTADEPIKKADRVRAGHRSVPFRRAEPRGFNNWPPVFLKILGVRHPMACTESPLINKNSTIPLEQAEFLHCCPRASRPRSPSLRDLFGGLTPPRGISQPQTAGFAACATLAPIRNQEPGSGSLVGL